MLIKLFIFLALHTVANRAAGMDRFAPGRNIYYVAPLMALAALVLFGPMIAVAVFFAWVLYRIPGWYGAIDMGRNGEHTYLRDSFVTMLNGARYGIGLVLGVAIYVGVTGISTINGEFFGDLLFMVISCGFITGLSNWVAYAIGHELWKRTSKDPTDPLKGAINPGTASELLAGFLIGFWLCFNIWGLYQNALI